MIKASLSSTEDGRTVHDTHWSLRWSSAGISPAKGKRTTLAPQGVTAHQHKVGEPFHLPKFRLNFHYVNQKAVLLFSMLSGEEREF